ncbi:hypothetical protein VCRA2119O147_510001 [Vibrio crassostreae]|nr:hypothetical protein VCRA2110O182_10259 [Vibrio crassostreae]CAK1851520.1 hypothetical protein VCRA2113O322_10249 [Vibrio crassostreae]CAK1866007.1 hypothetical protein VCRA2113O119_10240 [Vibrio crassostreae]CAK1866430.1 hypothetical protein VCRA2113O324_10245 [Vibrio crassostreae]CAK1870710.1 hypothetical protein VCRA2113O326_10246 [Vibrio crassostreae]
MNKKKTLFCDLSNLQFRKWLATMVVHGKLLVIGSKAMANGKSTACRKISITTAP